MDDITRTSCAIVWKAPDNDGGSPITGYYVERQQDYSSRWMKVNKSSVKQTQLEIKDLVETNEYVFRVVAENEAGCGPPSSATDIITAKDPFNKPGKPGQPIIDDIVKDTAVLSWAAPKDDGNSPIVHYVVEMRGVTDRLWSVANAGVKTPRNKYTVQGLKEGVGYEFRVIAENKVGAGPPSDSTEAVKFGKTLSLILISKMTCSI